ncbi:MAG: RIO1 family regulatory kinase/ATPase [Sulfolobales archaeon]
MGKSLHKIIPKIDEIDYKILGVLVKNLRRFEYIPLEIIIEESGIPRDTLASILMKLAELKVIIPSSSQNPLSYKLTFTGLNLYSLKKLAERDIIKAIGVPIGVGKESVVYIAKNYKDDLVAIKFYRIGWSSFREFSRRRGYGLDLGGSTWLLRSIVAAEREYSIMKKLINIIPDKIPQIFARELNAIVMEYIDGKELHKVLGLKNPLKIFSDIIDVIREVYLKLGIIHADLSPYNILVKDPGTEHERSFIFDWPQWVDIKEASAEKILLRDLRNIVRFFEKRFNLEINLEKIYKYVVGGAETLDYR